MNYFNIYDEQDLTKAVLYENATFNLKKILSSQTSIWCSAVTVITPTQTANFSFIPNYDNEEYNFLQHAFITDLLLSRLYPSYQRTKRKDDQMIYEREAKNNIFILTIESHLVIFIQPNCNISQYQYNELSNIIKQAKESEYATKKNTRGETIFQDFWILKNEIQEDIQTHDENQQIIPKDNIDVILNKLRKHITDITPLPQYNLNSFDFSDCKTDEDFMKKAEVYSKNYFDKSNIISYEDGSSDYDIPSVDDER